MKLKQLVILMAAIVIMMANVAPLYASEMDERIVSSAKSSHIWKTYLKGDDIKVESMNGMVTLTGEVSEGFHRQLAVETVESLPGVQSVDNKLTVRGTEPASDSDVEIAGKVKATLMFHRSTSVSTTDISVKDGRVTLSGVAKSLAQRDLASEYASDIDGVVGVDNQMTVPSAKTTAQTLADYMDDASITTQVKYTLLSHRSTSTLRTKVDTKDGVVTLSGIAKNSAERTLATLFANDVNGVKAVRNLMTIE